jgi:hypothetical protein
VEAPECNFQNVVDSCALLAGSGNACTAVNIELATDCAEANCYSMPSCPGGSSSACSEGILRFDGVADQQLTVDLAGLADAGLEPPLSVILVSPHAFDIAVLFDGAAVDCTQTDDPDPLWYEARCTVPSGAKQLEIRRATTVPGEQFWARLFLVPPCKMRSMESCAA